MIFSEKKISGFLDDLASSAPIPGGGGASALVGAISAALSSMMCNLTVGKSTFKHVENAVVLWSGELDEARANLLKLVDDDAVAYGTIAEIYHLPKQTEEQKLLRKERLVKAAQGAALVPLLICEHIVKVLSLTQKIALNGNHNLLTDAGCAAILGMAAFDCASLNVKVNLPLTHDENFSSDCNKKLAMYREMAFRSYLAILDLVNKN